MTDEELLDPWEKTLALRQRPDAAQALRELSGYHSYWSAQLSKARRRVSEAKLEKAGTKATLYEEAVISLQARGNKKPTKDAITAWIETGDKWNDICRQEIAAAYKVDVLTGKLVTIGIIKTALREESQTRIASMHFERGA